MMLILLSYHGEQYENYMHAVELCKLWQVITGWLILVRM